MTAVTADRVVVELEAKVREHDRRIKQSQQQFERSMSAIERSVEKAERNSSRSFQKLADGVRGGPLKSISALQAALAAVGVTAGLSGVGRGISVLADFGQAMSTVQAITRATDSQFTALEERARDLGATTRFSATQAAEGMLFLARAGFGVDDVLASIEGTLQLAQAGALDLGQAADIASNVLTGFRLETDQTARVVDVLAKAANSSNTTVGQLGDALKFVAPVAAGLGIEVEETTAAIAALSNAGLQSSLAGTGLRRVLSELESPASKTRSVLAELGITVEQVRPSTVGLNQALTTLARAGIDTGQALGDLWRSRWAGILGARKQRQLGS